MKDEILTVDQFALRINSTRKTVIRLIKEGKILAFRLSDGSRSPYRIKESEIERLICFELQKDYERKEK